MAEPQHIAQVAESLDILKESGYVLDYVVDGEGQFIVTMSGELAEDGEPYTQLLNTDKVVQVVEAMEFLIESGYGVIL